MKSNRTMIGGIAILLFGAVAIAAIWYFVLRTPEEASAPIESIPLELPTNTAVTEPTDTPAETPTDPPPTEAPEESSENSEAAAAPTETPTEVPPTATSEPTEEPGELLLFEINPEESEARFTLNEELRGEPTTVIGITDQVAGQIAANFQDLSTTQIGIIQINARTLATDNNFRNNAIRNRILFTDEFEFITFTPTEVTGLPEGVEVGEEITFEIIGDLQIRDTTNEVTFSVTATAVSTEQIAGTASTQVLRSDYDLQIPSVPGVANVTDEVMLELTFVANLVQP